MSTRIEFPQPEVVAPGYASQYWYVHKGAPYSGTWGALSQKEGHQEELAALARFEIYGSLEACEQRIAYDAQEMARLVIPAWWRKLGPDVQVRYGETWIDCKMLPGAIPIGWDDADPSKFRAKPCDVVVTVNGVEYRWPPTAKQGDPIGERFTAQVDFVACEESSCRWGNRTHLTRAGAEAQNAMLNAALGGGK